jgi:hypothetical protein
MTFNRSSSVACLLSIQILLCLCGCSKNDPENISTENLAIINTKPEIDLGEGDITDHPPENVAVMFVNYLDQYKIDNAVRESAALDRLNELGEKSKCYNEVSEDVDCAVKEGYWKGRLNTHLYSRAVDLNSDKIPDYILSGDSSAGFTHVYTFEYFVLLSLKDKSYTVALSTNASHFAVLPIVKNNGKVIVEGIDSYNGISANIWRLEGRKYVNEACFYTDKVTPYKNVKCFEPAK